MFAARISDSRLVKGCVLYLSPPLSLSLYIYLSSVYLAPSYIRHAAVARAQDRHCEVVNMKTKHVRAHALRCFDV